MKIALAQINPKVADLPGNLALIRAAQAKAQAAGAELAVFPEQSLPGYPALDLWEDGAFAEASERALKELARGVGDMGLLVGFIARRKQKVGKPLYNAAALLHRGKINALRFKSLLPTYDVFDETRYFEPAKDNSPIRYKGARLGVTICEDAWTTAPMGRRLYARDPIREQIRAGADILINISASPFERGKTRERLRLLSAHARKAKKPLLYCNMVGGNDEIVFDGASLVLDGSGRAVARGRDFAEDLLVVDTKALGRPLDASAFASDIEEVAEALKLGLRDYLRKCGLSRVFLGLSGGIDSAVTAALAAQALGPDAVTGVSMPSRYSSPGSLSDAEALARNLGIRRLILPIDGVFDSYLSLLKDAFAGKPEGLAEQNLQARIRGALLMALANKENGMALATGNKSELSVGYCTLYGDMAGGLAPLADVPKKTVYELARWINRQREVIPRSSIEKAPSAELKANQTDQDDLPPYEVVDAVLTGYIEERLGAKALARGGYPPEVVSDLLRRIDAAEYKRRQAPPSLKITPKAFGVGRRMPIARGSFR